MRPHERWIWTELIGFDSDRPDLGVSEYLDGTGFVPDAICLMMTSPDFALSHEATDDEVELPPDFCSRDGHELNPQRGRQVWTNTQLRGLIAGLQSRGVAVYVSMFTRFYGNQFHHEWVSDHKEVCQVFRDVGWSSSINCLSRLADGSYFEDIWVSKLVEVMEWYGFDGWHGADGWGPLSGPIYRVSLSDDMVAQFAEGCDLELPAVVTESCEDSPEKLEARAAWLWRHARHEWIEFYAERWAGFWRKAVTALHAAGKKAVINSSWGRAPFESYYRYGIDYRRIADTGVDGMIVETVAAGLCREPCVEETVDRLHDDFLSMLMLIKAAVPDTKLIFLHNVHDVVEQWDAIHHNPTVLEKDIYSLNNVYLTRADGSLTPCATGLLACLGDGVTPEEWRWLGERWALALSDTPRRTLGATLVWSDAAFDRQRDDFTAHRTWFTHRLLFHLMSEGAPVHAAARIEDLDAVTGPILVLNPHLLPEAELEAVLGYEAGAAILIGPEAEGRPLACRMHGAPAPGLADEECEALPEDVMGIEEPYGYWDHMTFAPVSEGFLKAAAETVRRVAGEVLVDDEAVSVMATETVEGAVRVALKNGRLFYARPVVDLGRPLESVRVVSPFPSMLVEPDGSTFTVRVPPEGVTVVEVRLARRVGTQAGPQ